MSSITAPRTIVTAEYLAAPDLNTWVRDNLRALIGHSANSQPFARATSTKPIALSSGKFSALTFDTAVITRGGLFTAPSSALIVPSGWAGTYLVGACVEIETAACNKALRMIVNGKTIIAEQDTSGVGSAAVGRIAISTFADLVAGDFVEAEAFHDLGVPLNASVAGSFSPVLWGAFYATSL